MDQKVNGFVSNRSILGYRRYHRGSYRYHARQPQRRRGLGVLTIFSHQFMAISMGNMMRRHWVVGSLATSRILGEVISYKGAVFLNVRHRLVEAKRIEEMEGV